MPDVVKIALERREALTREVQRLDDFVRMAEALINGGEPSGSAHSARNGTVRPEQSAAATEAEKLAQRLVRGGEAGQAR